MKTDIDTDFIEDLSTTSLLDEMSKQDSKRMVSSEETELPLHDGLKNVDEDNPSDTLYMALESHLTDDYNEGRERYQGIIKDSMKAFEVALSMAVESGDPKSITALSSLMKTITDVTNKQLEFTMKYKNDVGGVIASTLDGGSSASEGAVVTNQTNIQNNITVNTTSSETTEDFVSTLIDESPSMEERFSSKKH